MKKKLLVDVKIECDPPSFYWVKDQEDYAKRCEGWVKEFHEFIRDHRSQDPVFLNVERVYKEVCSFCKSEWEEDETGEPACCNAAVEEWKKLKATAA